MRRPDPGPCVICGGVHGTCGGAPITMNLLPASAALALSAASPGPSDPRPEGMLANDPAPLLAEQIQATLPPGQFTTGTYRGTKKGGRRAR